MWFRDPDTVRSHGSATTKILLAFGAGLWYSIRAVKVCAAKYTNMSAGCKTDRKGRDEHEGRNPS